MTGSDCLFFLYLCAFDNPHKKKPRLTHSNNSIHTGVGGISFSKVTVLGPVLADISRDSKADLPPMWTRLNRLTHARTPLEAGYGIRGQLQRISAPPLNLSVAASPLAQLPSSPLGLICDEQEVYCVISTRC